MIPRHLVLSILSLLVIPAPALLAQGVPDATGHWQGAVQAPDRQVSIEVDLARDNNGALAGTFTQPGDAVKGLPFASIAQEGRTVRLVLRVNSGGGTFNGTLSADGKSLDGDFIMNEGGYVLPFSMTRAGEARIPPEPKSPPIGKEFEGTWNGSLETGARPMRVSVTLTNQPDGTATGTIVSVDGSGVAIPVAMTQRGTTLIIDVPSVSASFNGTLNAQGTEIAGTWTQGGRTLPLTFRR